MKKTILRVGLAAASLAFLATSMFGQFLTNTGGCSTASDCYSCCATALGTGFQACFSGSLKNLGNCLSVALEADGTCLKSCPAPKNGGRCF
jgi:hypothetical protein